MTVELATTPSAATGVKCFRVVSSNTTVIEFANGGVRPATALELTMWGILTGNPPA